MDEKQLVSQALSAAIDGVLGVEQIAAIIEKPKSSDLGDLAFPAFQLAKTLRKSPQIIAGEIAEKIDTKGFEKVIAVGPYVNFFLDKNATASEVIREVLTEGEHYGDANIGQGGNVPIDMSAPNIAKPFSIGHLRSTVIGDSIAKIYEKLGYQPIKINHLGDWGKQFGLLITAYKKYGDEATITANPIDELLKLYVKINAEAKEDPEVDEEGRQWFLKMEQGDEEALRIWKWFSDVSLIEFNRIYRKLGVSFDHFMGESFYSDKMDAIVEDLESKNLLHESKGALIVDLEKYNLNPALIKKTDGATLYITRDLATAAYRKKTFNFVKSLYVVGGEQTNHFKQLKAVLKEAGYDWSDDMVHVPFGMVTQGGKKFSTRKGHVVKLEMALDEAVDRAEKQIEAKNPNLENKEEVAKQVGVGAVKFYDLKTDRNNGYDFDLDEMVSFEGETGPYVQYAHARIQSILRKANRKVDINNISLAVSDAEAWEIVKALKEFPNVVKRAADNYEPSVIAKYAISLAQAFNKYYAHVRILEDDAQLDGRLALISATSIVLKEALRLLGVAAPENM
ncbi:arginine--tRNA ligase [Lactococcus lactis subsp. lactis]|uniref:Arginine--tRNA ligase n=1 Tax=Lactococcus lactis subsp. lactis TaxID=1360 RepID=A0A1V0NIR9_LACLL|nr:arginine--tRNA ligase [Lactococcus lactis]MRL87463.1 arginine--tRNA ligase [Lactococcus cremoris]ADZ64645.1 arginyl-tRNA synthetase [Lactococcus lactis subsp. lactis CV56]ARD99820.1 arginyl-tRNA synthetase [Lactococcus lactis subsp. lactis]EHE94351.1 Arginine--tRNA ligase [Lactococcus lactis subsp. lactis CNCM I-1631]KAF0955833.1 arginine--tRNA ligase [Lactococcus lactis subsp. lactis]